MDWLRILQILGAVIVVGVGLGAGFGGFYYAFNSKSNKLLKEAVSDLGSKYRDCDVQHKDSLKLIHQLEGQIQVIKEIPLSNIAESLGGIAQSNDQILRTLRSSALIAEEDRVALMPKEQHIEHQEVEHQVINNKE